MIVKVAVRVKNNFPGKVYILKMVKNEWVPLERENRLNQVLAEMKGLKFF
jgi:hypothetical protein